MRMSEFDLTPLMRPKRVAIIGASPKVGTIGARPLANLRRFGFGGDIALVSRSAVTIDGIACAGDVAELPEGVDTAMLVVPSTAAEDVLRRCADRGVRSAVIFSSGFAEMGAEGQAAQRRLADIARDAAMPLCGPNGLGIVNYADRAPLTFGWIEPVAPPAAGGRLAILSQSGAMGMALTYAAQSRGVGLSFTVSSGNEAALTLSDYLAFVLDDPGTQVVAVLAEQIREPDRFLALCDRAVAATKPVVVLKLGRSDEGKAAALSHTGSMAGDYATSEAAMQARGVVLVDSMAALLAVAGLFARAKPATGDGVGLMSDSGALVTFALDQAEGLGLRFARLAAGTQQRLRELLPPFATIANPLDMTTQGMNNPDLYRDAAKAMLDDANIAALGIFAMPGASEHALARAELLLPLLRDAEKPVAYTLLGGRTGDAAADRLQGEGVAVFRQPEAALHALAHLTMHHHFVPGPAITLSPAAPSARLKTGTLAEYAAKSLLAERGIAVPPGVLVKTADAVAGAAASVGFPLAMKVQSSQIVHKTEVGGVVLGVADEESAHRAYEDIMLRAAAAQPDATIDGVLVEAMSGAGVEMAIGSRRDREWGPTVMVALGGIWIEVMQDARLVPAPLDRRAALAAIRKLRAFPILEGARGQAPADVEALAGVMIKVGALMIEHPEIDEIDINPLCVSAAGAVAVDASIVVGARG